ncbi:hypothetical protein [Herpetosiphon geysericola]|uniref:Uncharacterized protein n=1 Tax=Herpetosiphon geysericola TaxID=70996 RepID=A0A0P6XRK4_9CHLR|nr:hypothetical protein [Herpetosiphon geysericola]KPL85207.1 hypothetical protein SE18_16070 [Herpetosiphon geysericola]
MLDVEARNQIVRLEKEVQALRSEIRSLRADLHPMINPRSKPTRHPTFERNLAPEREPEALADVAQQLSEQVSMDEIGAYLNRDRIKASDIQLTEQDIKRNRPRNHLAHEGYPNREARLEFLWNNSSLFILLFFLIGMLIFFLVIL